MTVVQYEVPTPLPPSVPGDELAEGPRGDVARLRAAAEYAGHIGNTPFVPEPLRGQLAEVAAAIVTGAELGLKPMQSLRMTVMIKGQPTFLAAAQRGLVAARGHEIWFEESTVTRAIAAGRRRDSDRIGRVTWTMDDAKRAGIAGQPNYAKYPAEMLRARASAALARAMFPDVLYGIPAAEEVEGYVYVENGSEPAEPSPPPPDASPPAAGGRTRRRRPAPVPAGAGPVSPTPPPDEQPAPPITPEPPATDAMKRRIFASMRDLGLSDRDERLAYTRAVVDREIETSNDLTIGEASRLIDQLDADRAARLAGEEAFLDELRARLDAEPVEGPRSAQGEPEPPGGQQAAEAAGEPDAASGARGAGDQRDRLDELVTDALERGVRVADLWTQAATYRHQLPDQLLEELGGRDATGRILWQPLRDSLRRDEIGDLAAYIERVIKPPPDDEIPF